MSKKQHKVSDTGSVSFFVWKDGETASEVRETESCSQTLGAGGGGGGWGWTCSISVEALLAM
jgi:hypothetical protein